MSPEQERRSIRYGYLLAMEVLQSPLYAGEDMVAAVEFFTEHHARLEVPESSKQSPKQRKCVDCDKPVTSPDPEMLFCMDCYSRNLDNLRQQAEPAPVQAEGERLLEIVMEIVEEERIADPQTDNHLRTNVLVDRIVKNIRRAIIAEWEKRR